MAIYYPDIIKRQVAKGFSTAQSRKDVDEVVQKRFDSSVKKMQDEFEKHPVTQELSEGVTASNISKTLHGGPAPQNLFAFIGFEKGTDPTQHIRDRLNPEHEDGPDYKYIGMHPTNPLVFQYGLKGPNVEKIYEATQIPWAPGLSWAEKIERNIPGFAYFFAMFTENPKSHSGGGFQNKKEIEPGATFSPPEDGYLTNIFKRFRDRMLKGNYSD
jgi:hypothetical protein